MGLRKKLKFQAGQTLIETMAAVFILVMGITAAMGLAIYAFSNSSNITKQIVAVGLAREGVESVRNMRDTNWLKSSLDNNCHDFTDTVGSNDNDGKCYQDWLGQGHVTWLNQDDNNYGYDIDPGRFLVFWISSGNQAYRLRINPDKDDRAWDLTRGSNNFGLDKNENFSDGSFRGAYVPNTTSSSGNSEYYRKIVLATDGVNDDNPFATNIGRRLQVISQVWWTDKKCPRVNDYALAKAACRVEVQSFLTNWKDY